MLGQHGTAAFDGRNEAIGRAAGGDGRHQGVDCVVPDGLRDLFVDRGVGDDLGVAVGLRSEDEDAGAPFGFVQAVGEELA